MSNQQLPDPTTVVLPGVAVLPSDEITFDTVPVLPVDDGPFMNIENGQNSGIWGYGITVLLASETGLEGSPVAGPAGTQCAIWREHGGWCKKWVGFFAARFGEPPVPPAADTGSANDVLRTRILITPAPEIMPDATPLYVMMGQYEFICQQMPADTDPILYPNSPLLPPASRFISPVDFDTTLIGPAPSPAGFDGVAIDY